MNARAIAAALAAVLLTGAAARAQPAPPTAEAPAPVPGQPVERRPPNGEGQVPAWPTQTRAPFRPSGVAFEVRTVAAGLEQPWGLAFLPDGRMLVTERPGRMRIVSGGKLSEAIAGVPPVRVQAISGMMDVAVDPRFAENRLVYWTYLEDRPTGSGTTLARGRLVDGAQPKLEDVKVIYRQEPGLVTTHSNYGGRLLFAEDGTLFVSLGDRDELEWRPLIQKTDNGVGKVVRIRTDGSPAPGGPFEGRAGYRAEIYAMGFRNPLGLALRPGTQELWVVDVGPRGGDELDMVRPGSNQGWPLTGYGREYSGEPVGAGPVKEGYEQPTYYWDPVISPSSVTFYDGDRFPAWKGNVFVTSLSQRHLVRLELDAAGRVAAEERLLTDVDERLRMVKQGPDGTLYVLTDMDEGRLLQLVPAGG